MDYVINVALNGRHYFATAEGSIIGVENARRVYFDFLERFPKAQGFEVTVIKWEKTGTYMEWVKD